MPYGDPNNVKELDDLLKLDNTEENRKKAEAYFGYLKTFDIQAVGTALQGENGEHAEDFRKADFSENGSTRNYSVFAVWLMGEKGLSIEQVAEIMPGTPKFQDYVDEFHVFLANHPVATEKDPTENVRAWTKLYLASVDQLKKFEFPDIDYSNPTEVAKHSHVLSVLCALQIDMSQEFDKVTKNRKGMAAQETGNSTEKLAEAMAPWTAIQELTTHIKTAYFNHISTPIYDSLKKNKTVLLEPVVNSRLYLKQHNKKFAGKKMDEYLKEKAKEDKITNLYKPYLDATLASSNKASYASDKTKNFLLGQPTDIEKTYVENLTQKEDSARRSLNDGAYLSGAKEFQRQFFVYAKKEKELMDPDNSLNENELNVTIPYLFSGGEVSPEEMLTTLKSPNATELFTFINSAFEQITNQGLTADDFNKAVGIGNVTSLFKIDGKRPEELWGQKYANIKSEGDRELLYKTEIIREMLYGSANVTIDIAAVNENKEIVQVKPYTVMQSNDVMVQSFPFYRALNDLHKDLSEELDILKATQADPEKNFVQGKGTEGSAEYRAMLGALKKCVDITDINKGYNIKDLYGAMNELKKASAKYHKSHASSLIKGYSKNRGRVRVNSANHFKGDYLVSEYTTLKELYSLTDIEPSKHMDLQIERGSFNEGLEMMNKMCAVKGGKMDMARIQAPNFLADKIYNFSNQKKELRRMLNDASKGLHTKTEKGDYMFSDLSSYDGKQAVTNAKKIVKNKYMKFVNKVSPKSDVTIDELQSLFMEDDFVEKFHSEVDGILNDKKFIELMNNDPENCVAKYEEIKARQNVKYHNFMKETSEAYEKLSQKYPDPAVCEFKWDSAEKQLKSWENEMNREEDQITSIRTYALDYKDAFKASNVLINNHTLANNPELQENLYHLNFIKDSLSRTMTLSIMKDEIKSSSDQQETGMMMAIDSEEFKKTQKLVLKALENDDNLFSKDANTFCSALTLMWGSTKRNVKKFIADEKAKEAEKQNQANKGGKKAEVKKPAAGKK